MKLLISLPEIYFQEAFRHKQKMPSPVNNTQYVAFTNLFCLSSLIAIHRPVTNILFPIIMCQSFSTNILLALRIDFYIYVVLQSVNIASDLIRVSKSNICKYALSKTIEGCFIFLAVLNGLHLSLRVLVIKIMFRRYSTYSGKTFQKIKSLLQFIIFTFFTILLANPLSKKPLCPK